MGAQLTTEFVSLVFIFLPFELCWMVYYEDIVLHYE